MGLQRKFNQVSTQSDVPRGSDRFTVNAPVDSTVSLPNIENDEASFAASDGLDYSRLEDVSVWQEKLGGILSEQEQNDSDSHFSFSATENSEDNLLQYLNIYVSDGSLVKRSDYRILKRTLAEVDSLTQKLHSLESNLKETVENYLQTSETYSGMFMISQLSELKNENREQQFGLPSIDAASNENQISLPILNSSAEESAEDNISSSEPNDNIIQNEDNTKIFFSTFSEVPEAQSLITEEMLPHRDKANKLAQEILDLESKRDQINIQRLDRLNEILDKLAFDEVIGGDPRILGEKIQLAKEGILKSFARS